MKLKSFSVKNFRRLKQTHVNLEDNTTIFVGSNNSGKTSATHLFQLMLGGSKGKFSIYDFSSDCWDIFNKISLSSEIIQGTETTNPIDLPIIELDIWFETTAQNLHRVIDLLPSLDWDNTPIGVRITFEPKDPAQTLKNFQEAKLQANKTQVSKEESYVPWPKDMMDFLNRHLSSEYHICHYVLDSTERNHQGVFIGKNPKPLGDKQKSGETILKSLVRVDFLNAQRHLSDDSQSGRTEDLSKRFSRFYKNNLEQKDNDFDAIRSLAKAQLELDKHLTEVFTPTLDRLKSLGYPGLESPNIVIRSNLNADSIMGQNTSMHYNIGGVEKDTSTLLPDKYNGLGFKNLIFMFVELLHFQKDWQTTETERPLLHLLFIEEPEAHLHAQVQKVFIESIKNTLGIAEEGFSEQFVVTTHSSHILYNSGFKPVRYFRRKGKALSQSTEILDLSCFLDTADESVEFLQRYMRLTHCDLFFADAVVLVEGNVERMLVPLIIEKVTPKLQSCYLSILEVGGAHMHRFLPLLEFLGLTTLIITDLDSVILKKKEKKSYKSSCTTWTPNAKTNNAILHSHFPKLKSITELLLLSEEQKTKILCAENGTNLRVAYQMPVMCDLNQLVYAGRTFEEAFAFENLPWVEEAAQKPLKLKITGSSIEDKFTSIYDLVRKKSFKKADFALELLNCNPSEWIAPFYISEGLKWLENEVQSKNSFKI